MSENRYNRERQKIKRIFNLATLIYPLIEKNLLPQYRDALAQINLPKNLNVLDFATGSGILAGAFADRGHQVEGIDFSSRLLKRAALNYPDIKFRNQDLFELDPIICPQYDIVSMGYLLHGLSPELRKIVLHKAVKVAKYYVLIFDHGQKGNWIVDFIEFFEGSYYKQFIAEDHKQAYSAVGLKIVSEFETSEYGYMWLCKKK